jgi:predicted alpha/beta hydrolase family esterase
VRWLGDTKQVVDMLVLVAPWKIPEPGDASRAAYYGFEIDPTIKDHIRRIVIFTSDDEEEDGKQSVAIFHAALGGELIKLKGRGHFTTDSMGTDAFPELLEVVER